MFFCQAIVVYCYKVGLLNKGFGWIQAKINPDHGSKTTDKEQNKVNFRQPTIRLILVYLNHQIRFR
jgi:hypothetical protein